MESNQLQSGTPAPYGRACINCSRAKSKCILLATGNGCERCQRLKKDCRPSPTVRKRNARSSASRTAQLEAKLDNIVSLLQTNGGPTGIPADWDVALPTTGQNASSQSQTCASSCSLPSGGIPTPPATVSAPNSCSVEDLCSTLPIPPETAEQTLSYFRTENMKYLPFVHIPSHMTSQQLRQEKPFLWLCIMAVLMPGSIQRESVFTKITGTIHQKLLVDSSPSMDMLLGIMTFISWTTYARRPFLNFYAHVVMGLVCDLGINKPVPTEYSTMQAFKSAVGVKQHIPTTRTMEERRAALGCFLITSRIDALRWNPHLEESLSILMNAKECPEDERLVSLVKIHLVMDRVYHLQRDGDSHSPATFYTKAFQSQLKAVKSTIPAHLQEDRSILLYLTNAELTIHDVALQAPSTPNSPELHRLESLYTSLQAAKSWLDLWLSVPVENYTAVSFTIFFQFSRALVSLYRLSILEDPAWDKTLVRNTANILEYLDRMANMMKNCADHISVPHQPEWNIFEKGQVMVRCIKEGWEPKLMEVWYPSLPSTEVENDFNQPNPALSDILPITGFDDAWMMEIFGSM
ncbi:uncharacterized protein N7482_008357 [Penicillium canariense]|uniref:Zn(2)-C6 fungal-type domain-containing protein n=1 Tax=Penicillium canariense TaxID=189055 RepID=A0A9W9LIN8_9EURO|nr:uncharacterized protein N7482_008357 [Penicillium canariense]KAJ5157257.1 hypothetical protein N7482_008357 [Penicillium canariense]